ncbi:hypothetical protein K402DRAFT_404935 [Aulographum hederae CBS 113979]|uniref:PNPLA domain-containing protein n=1 Tax=Aulographum hederae CBS 113979 TaxID=1176131 RepID=A0A6G1GXX6_9PEZI|nr:hypothetical protein K402DRAFT_404935 [Aulographum hederae CBS 113979]
MKASPSPPGPSILTDALAPEQNPMAPLRLLSLDGGGVRGLSSLMVLEDLMENIVHEEKRIGKRPVSNTETLKPCDYFDLIGGTSTGGIIAILLARLRLDCRQCIEIYSEMSKKIFLNDRSFSVAGLKLPLSKTRFSGKVLEQAIKDAMKRLNYDENELMWDDSLFEEIEDAPNPDSIWADVQNLEDSPQDLTRTNTSSSASRLLDKALSASKDASQAAPAQVRTSIAHPVNDTSTTPLKRHNSFAQTYGATNGNIAGVGPHLHHKRTPTWKVRSRNSVHRKPHQKGCRAFVVSALKNALGLPRILATYDPNDRTTKIWEALRATSAAPTFFEEMTFGTPRMTYLDGGVGFNNPCAEVDYAAKSLWEGRSIGVIVSVGTGLQTIPSVKKAATWLPFGLGVDIALASALASMATGTARVDNEMQRMYYDTDTAYFRFDVDGGLVNVSLEQWMKEDEMAALTEQYMSDPRQLRRARHLGELMVKLSALPPAFEIKASDFHVGMKGRGILDGHFVHQTLDFKSSLDLHRRLSMNPAALSELESRDRPQETPGLAIADDGHTPRPIYPILSDVDHDGLRQEAVILSCVRAEEICLRTLRTGIPQGVYKVVFLVHFAPPVPPSPKPASPLTSRSDTALPDHIQESPPSTGSDTVPPTDLVFSVGKPWDTTTFLTRTVDVRISADVVPVLLRPDAVRVRVGKQRYEEGRGKGWIEVEAGELVKIGLDGALGVVVSKTFEEGRWCAGWSLGGVRVEPVFGGEGREDMDIRLLVKDLLLQNSEAIENSIHGTLEVVHTTIKVPPFALGSILRLRRHDFFTSSRSIFEISLRSRSQESLRQEEESGWCFISHSPDPRKYSVDIPVQFLIQDFLVDRINKHTPFTPTHCTYNQGGTGPLRLRTATANLINDYFHPHKEVSAEHTTFAAGVTALNELLALTLCDVGDAIMLGQPAYGSFGNDLVQRTGVHLSLVPFPISSYSSTTSSPFTPSAAQIYEDALLEAKDWNVPIKALLICNPHNPLGACYSYDALLALVRLAVKYNIHLISDEIYALSVFREVERQKRFTSVLEVDLEAEGAEGLVHVLYGFSKWYSTSLRLGCLITRNTDVASAIWPQCRFPSPSEFSSEIGTQILEDRDFVKEFLTKSRAELAAGYQRASRHLDRMDIPYYRDGVAGFFIWMDLSNWLPMEEAGEDGWEAEKILSQRFVDADVVMSSAKAYHGTEPGWFRLIFSLEKEALEEGLKRYCFTAVLFPLFSMLTACRISKVLCLNDQGGGRTGVEV